MVVKGKKRQERSLSSAYMRRDRDEVVHQRSTHKPVPFVSKFSVKAGTSTLEILRSGETGSEGSKGKNGR